MPYDFVVLSTMRSGSYHLVSLLDSAADLMCYGEIYKPNHVELPRPTLRALGLRAAATKARNAMGAELLARLKAADPSKGIGFKLFTWQMHQGPEFLRPEVFSGRRRIVCLTRPALEIAVSLAAAQASGVYTHHQGAQLSPAMEVRPTHLERARDMAKRLAGTRRRLQRTPGVELFDLTYEDLSDPARLDATLAFLGSDASARSLASNYRRQSSGPVHTRVSNWPQVVAQLRETAPRMLDAAGYGDNGNQL